MTDGQPDTHRLHIATPAILLFLLLVIIYTLTFNGFPMSGDEVILFDATESVTNHQNLSTNITFDYGYLGNAVAYEAQVAHERSEGQHVWGGSRYEPLQPILASPLLFLSQNLSVGRVHTVWLFNIFIGALTSTAIYLYGVQMRYSPKIAWLSAFLFGIGTVYWPYTQLFFREPLTGLFWFLSFWASIVFAKHLHARIDWPSFGSLFIALVLATLTKGISLLIIPSVFIILIPSYKRWWRYRAQIVMFVAAFMGLVSFILILNSQLNFLTYRLTPMYILDRINAIDDWSNIQTSLLGYHVSWGASIWFYSPILILGIPGLFLLYKQGDYALSLALLLLLIGFPLVYGYLRQGIWWGGVSYGPRYLVPITPVIMLAVLPTMQWIHDHWHNLVTTILAVLIVGLAILIQVLAVLFPVTEYYDYLNAHSINAGTDGIWQWKWSHFGVELKLFDLRSTNFIWSEQSSQPWLVLGVLCAIMIAALVLLAKYSGLTRRKANLLSIGLLGLTLVSLGLAMYTIRDDARYYNDYDPWYTLVEEFNHEVANDDAVFLEDNSFRNLFMNNLGNGALLVTLPYPPGERYSPDVAPQVESKDTAILVGAPSDWVLSTVTAERERVWLIMNRGPFLSFAVRPAERYMIERYFPVKRIEPADNSRAILFYTEPIPEGLPKNDAHLIFADELELVGYDLPQGTHFAPDEIIPVSLVWELVQPASTDYNLSVQLANEVGVPVVQRDGLFQDTFGYTSRWEVGTQYRDNHGLLIPKDLVPGTYQIQVIVYTWQDGQRLSFTAPDGEVEGDVAVLSAITIQ